MAVVKNRRRGRTRASTKHQITIPAQAWRKAGLKAGDELQVEAVGSGRVVLRRVDDVIARYAGIFTGLYPKGYLKKLRDEWR